MMAKVGENLNLEESMRADRSLRESSCRNKLHRGTSSEAGDGAAGREEVIVLVFDYKVRYT